MKLDVLPAPADDIGTNLEGFIATLSPKSGAASLRDGKIGLQGLAHTTFYATLYCWKWTMIDFERNPFDLKELFLMKRYHSLVYRRKRPVN